MAYYIPPSEKVGGLVPHQIAPMHNTNSDNQNSKLRLTQIIPFTTLLEMQLKFQ